MLTATTSTCRRRFVSLPETSCAFRTVFDQPACVRTEEIWKRLVYVLSVQAHSHFLRPLENILFLASKLRVRKEDVPYHSANGAQQAWVSACPAPNPGPARLVPG